MGITAWHAEGYLSPRMGSEVGLRALSAAIATISLTAACSAPSADPAGRPQENSAQRSASGAPFLQLVPDAFSDSAVIPAEACMRDVWSNEEYVVESAAWQGAAGRESPTALAALMRDTFGAAPVAVSQQLLCAKAPRAMSVADLNHNGHLDLLAAVAGEGNKYWLNDGSGRFSSHRYDPLGIGDFLDFPSALQAMESDFIESDSFVCDLNGDGASEVITIHASSGQAYPISIQRTGPAWPNTPVTRVEAPAHLGAVGGLTCGDINGDGVLDIVYTVRGGPHEQPQGSLPIRALLSGPGGYRDGTEAWVSDQERRSRPQPGAAGSPRWRIMPFEPRLVDLTGNGLLDLVVTADWGALLLYENAGDRFVRHGTPLEQHYNTMGIVAIDLTGNRQLDLLITDIDLRNISTCRWHITCQETHQSPGGNVVLLQDGPMQLVRDTTSSLAEAFLYNGWGWGFTTADLNGDGYWDRIQASGEIGLASESSLAWAYRMQPPAVLIGGADGFENQTRAWVETWNLPNGSFSITAADMTGNGAPDLIVYGHAVGGPQLYKNLTPPDQFAHLHVTHPSTVTIRHPDGRTETFRLPDRHGSMLVTSNAPWSFGVGDLGADVQIRFDTGEQRTHRIYAGQTLRVGP